MDDSAALSEVTDVLPSAAPTRPPVAAGRTSALTISMTHCAAEVEAAWRQLSADGVESPGQGYDFIRLWTEARGIPEADQFYFLAERDGRPVALAPLHRRRVKGVRVLSWFPGPHVGCNAPLVDRAALLAMTAGERAGLWQKLLRGSCDADVVYLRAIPTLLVDGVDLFAELGQSLETETLYRAQFTSWEDANTTQRSKSRRKHDRQQGEKLEALGKVEFEAVGNGLEALAILDTMFRQRAARFRDMGVWDPFAAADIRAFYNSTARENSGVPIRLHVLRLNGDIVAVRYNIVAGDRLFCLISSMSDDKSLQAGSPGKQCLLRVMQTEFDSGARMFDMGAGFTDEKRHWCNVQIPVRQHYLPITRRGALAAAAHIGWQKLRHRIKSDERLLGLAKRLRGAMLAMTGKAATVEKPVED